MALLADGIAASLEDLAAHDSSVLAVAKTEGIDLTSKLALAHASVTVDLESMLSPLPLESVVVTSVVTRVLIYSALEHTYRDAYNSQLNDRYEGRRRQYEALRREAWRSLLETGVGLVEEPLLKALSPEVSSVPGSGKSGTFYMRCAWVNRRGEEGSPSDAVLWTGAWGTTFRTRAPERPPHASGWNLYVGPGPEETKKQNGEPLSPEAAWVQEGQVSTTGRPPGNGQLPNYIRAVPRVLRRG